jgi:hypothetical protein
MGSQPAGEDVEASRGEMYDLQQEEAATKAARTVEATKKTAGVGEQTHQGEAEEAKEAAAAAAQEEYLATPQIRVLTLLLNVLDVAHQATSKRTAVYLHTLQTCIRTV